MEPLMTFDNTSSESEAITDVFLHGRFFVHEGEEHTCDIIGISKDAVIFNAGKKVAPHEGDKIVIYVDQLGRMIGTASVLDQGTYFVTLDLVPSQKARLEKKIQDLGNEDEIPIEIEYPSEINTIELSDRSVHPCKVYGVSLWGAYIKADANIKLEEKVRLGTMAGVVKRIDHKGIRIAFTQDGDLRAASKHFKRVK